ncbi:MAG: leucine-rich repeat protein, partial [Eubacterium sp.]|nr:leucine-rich repeat protein [Eubacterium sp.]
IPNTVKINGKTYKVTSISNNVFKGCKKLKEVTIGTNVKKIGKKAFYNCKKLKKIIIKTTKLNSSNVGSNAFKGLSSKTIIKVPKKKLKAYKKLFKKKGFSGKVK